MSRIYFSPKAEPTVFLTTEGHAIRIDGVTLVLDAVQFADLLDAMHAYTSDTKAKRTWVLV